MFEKSVHIGRSAWYSYSTRRKGNMDVPIQARRRVRGESQVRESQVL